MIILTLRGKLHVAKKRSPAKALFWVLVLLAIDKTTEEEGCTKIEIKAQIKNIILFNKKLELAICCFRILGPI